MLHTIVSSVQLLSYMRLHPYSRNSCFLFSGDDIHNAATPGAGSIPLYTHGPVGRVCSDRR
eukprot:COSAG02_NODE_32228_length_519_cov_6.121359_1_plen_60_part_10